MSNNEQVCKHYTQFNDPASKIRNFCHWRRRCVSCSGQRDKCECFEPREKRKVRKEFKAWAVMENGVVIDISFDRVSALNVVEFAGYYEVEE